ncbi:hypothetical protein V1511DRAFT_501700 [Dipodascopsis uninucleata]
MAGEDIQVKRTHSMAFVQDGSQQQISSSGISKPSASSTNGSWWQRVTSLSMSINFLCQVQSWLSGAVQKLGLKNFVAIPESPTEEQSSKRARLETSDLDSKVFSGTHSPSPGSFPTTSLEQLSGSRKIEPEEPQSPSPADKNNRAEGILEYPKPLTAFSSVWEQPRYPKFVRLDTTPKSKNGHGSDEFTENADSGKDEIAQRRRPLRKSTGNNDLRRKVLLKKDPLRSIRPTVPPQRRSTTAIFLAKIKQQQQQQQQQQERRNKDDDINRNIFVGIDQLNKNPTLEKSGASNEDTKEAVHEASNAKKPYESAADTERDEPSSELLNSNSDYGSVLPGKIDRSLSSKASLDAQRRLAEQLRRRRQSDLKYGSTNLSLKPINKNITVPDTAADAPETPSNNIETPTYFRSAASSTFSIPSGRRLSPGNPFMSVGRITRYRSPFKNMGIDRPHIAGPASSLSLETLRNNLYASTYVTSPLSETRSPGRQAGLISRRDMPLSIRNTESVDELLKQLIKEGNANDFPSWKAIQERRKERAQAIKDLRQVKKEVIKPLTNEQLQKVNNCLHNHDLNRVLVSGFRIDITVRDIRTLGDGQWLNDNIIDFYLEMITQRSRISTTDGLSIPRSFVYTTHFYTTLSNKGYKGVSRWAKRKQLVLDQTDYIFVPINVHNTHWCVSIINLKNRRFEYYDSLGGGAGDAFDHLRQYIVNESKQQVYDLNDIDYWTEYVSKDSPMQENGYDCGVFTCKTIEVLSRNGLFSFSQKDMSIIRRRMIYEILEKQIMS